MVIFHSANCKRLPEGNHVPVMEIDRVSPMAWNTDLCSCVPGAAGAGSAVWNLSGTCLAVWCCFSRTVELLCFAFCKSYIILPDVILLYLAKHDYSMKTSGQTLKKLAA